MNLNLSGTEIFSIVVMAVQVIVTLSIRNAILALKDELKSWADSRFVTKENCTILMQK